MLYPALHCWVYPYILHSSPRIHICLCIKYINRSIFELAGVSVQICPVRMNINVVIFLHSHNPTEAKTPVYNPESPPTTRPCRSTQHIWRPFRLMTSQKLCSLNCKCAPHPDKCVSLVSLGVCTVFCRSMVIFWGGLIIYKTLKAAGITDLIYPDFHPILPLLYFPSLSRSLSLPPSAYVTLQLCKAADVTDPSAVAHTRTCIHMPMWSSWSLCTLPDCCPCSCHHYWRLRQLLGSNGNWILMQHRLTSAPMFFHCHCPRWPCLAVSLSHSAVTFPICPYLCSWDVVKQQERWGRGAGERLLYHVTSPAVAVAVGKSRAGGEG